MWKESISRPGTKANNTIEPEAKFLPEIDRALCPRRSYLVFFFDGALLSIFPVGKSHFVEKEKRLIGVLPVEKTQVTIPPRIAEQDVR